MQHTARALVPSQEVSALSIPTVADLDRMADKLDRNSRAENTERGYRSDWTNWVDFCRRHGMRPLPADPIDVRRYLTHLVEVGGRKKKKLTTGTVERHIAAIAYAHRARKLAFDTKDPALATTLSGIRRTYGAPQQGACALRSGDIIAICKTFAGDTRSIRDKAIILLGFAGGFRRSEIVALTVSDLTFEKGLLRIDLRRSKTDQTGQGRSIIILPGTNPQTCPVTAMRGWLEKAQLRHDGSEPVFRPVGSRGTVEFTGLCDKTVDRIVKAACQTAGLKGRYSAHSLRAGHVTEALAHGADRAAVKRQTGHRSDAMVDRYAREADLAVNNSSSSLGL